MKLGEVEVEELKVESELEARRSRSRRLEVTCRRPLSMSANVVSETGVGACAPGARRLRRACLADSFNAPETVGPRVHAMKPEAWTSDCSAAPSTAQKERVWGLSSARWCDQRAVDGCEIGSRKAPSARVGDVPGAGHRGHVDVQANPSGYAAEGHPGLGQVQPQDLSIGSQHGGPAETHGAGTVARPIQRQPPVERIHLAVLRRRERPYPRDNEPVGVVPPREAAGESVCVERRASWTDRARSPDGPFRAPGTLLALRPSEAKGRGIELHLAGLAGVPQLDRGVERPVPLGPRAKNDGRGGLRRDSNHENNV